MTAGHDLDPVGADRLGALLRERADVANDIDPPVELIIGRSQRVRGRRRAGLVTACVAVAVVLVVGGLAVAGRSVPATVTTDVANDGGDPHAATRAEVGAPPRSLVIPFQRPASARPGGAPLRLGLDLAGATVRSANDVPQLEVGTFSVRHSTVTVVRPSGEGWVVVTVATEPDPAGRSQVWSRAGQPVTLPSGRVAAINDFRGDDAFADIRPPVVLYGTVAGDLPLVVDGYGVTPDDVLAVASVVSVDADGTAVVLDPLPEGFEHQVVPPLANLHNEITYQLADGASASVGIALEPTSADLADLQLARDGSGDGVSSLPVRSTIAAVRRFEGSGGRDTTVTWLEPAGQVARLWIRSPVGVAEPDPATVAAAVVPLDEATFQGYGPYRGAVGGG